MVSAVWGAPASLGICTPELAELSQGQAGRLLITVFHAHLRHLVTQTSAFTPRLREATALVQSRSAHTGEPGLELVFDPKARPCALHTAPRRKALALAAAAGKGFSACSG